MVDLALLTDPSLLFLRVIAGAISHLDAVRHHRDERQQYRARAFVRMYRWSLTVG